LDVLQTRRDDRALDAHGMAKQVAALRAENDNLNDLLHWILYSPGCQAPGLRWARMSEATDNVICAATGLHSAAFVEAMFEYFDSCGMLTQVPLYDASTLGTALVPEGSEAVAEGAGSKPTTWHSSAGIRSTGSVVLQTSEAGPRGKGGQPRQLSPIDMLLVVLVVLRTDAPFDLAGPSSASARCSAPSEQ
jgi:hypothetical protein